jgi:formamidopyrimidine-DNA glycosylase
MPELPEVETYLRELTPELVGRRIVAAHVDWPRTIALPSSPEFARAIIGRRFDHFERRGKYMIFGLDDSHTLIVHLRMTGKLQIVPNGAPSGSHTHVVLDLDDSRSLHYRDPRKFGRIWLTDAPDLVLAKLGPEPLGQDFSAEELARTLAGRRASIKALLLDQTIVAGIGNIYADEALFRARLHPACLGGSLDAATIAVLCVAVREVLAEAIVQNGSSLGGSTLQNYMRPGGAPGGFQDQHMVFRRTGLPCLVCGRPIQRIILAQRSTHFCPGCQPARPNPST